MRTRAVTPTTMRRRSSRARRLTCTRRRTASRRRCSKWRRITRAQGKLTAGQFVDESGSAGVALWLTRARARLQATHAGVLRDPGAGDRDARAAAWARAFSARTALRLHAPAARGALVLRTTRLAAARRALSATRTRRAARARISRRAMPLRILNVAYPLAPIGPDAVGGAEQVLTMLDAALVRAGHESLVLACDGSRASGELIATRSVAVAVRWRGARGGRSRATARRSARCCNRARSTWCTCTASTSSSTCRSTDRRWSSPCTCRSTGMRRRRCGPRAPTCSSCAYPSSSARRIRTRPPRANLR